jgi:hypothetical protein
MDAVTPARCAAVLGPERTRWPGRDRGRAPRLGGADGDRGRHNGASHGPSVGTLARVHRSRRGRPPPGCRGRGAPAIGKIAARVKVSGREGSVRLGAHTPRSHPWPLRSRRPRSTPRTTQGPPPHAPLVSQQLTTQVAVRTPPPSHTPPRSHTMAGRGGAGRSRTLAPLVAAGALLPGPNVLSCSVAGRDYYAGEGGGRGGGQGRGQELEPAIGRTRQPLRRPLAALSRPRCVPCVASRARRGAGKPVSPARGGSPRGAVVHWPG